MTNCERCCRIAQLVRTRAGADDGRRRRENRVFRVRVLRRETAEVSHVVPLSEGRSSAILPCCAGAEVDPRRTGAADGGRCASPQYAQCELVAKNSVHQDRCPHLEEIRVQYCGVSPVTKLVPFSDSQLSSCTSNTYRYCDSYLLLARPHATTPPANLLYTPNHFWLDSEESGLCHIGIDGFLADVAGQRRRHHLCHRARHALSIFGAHGSWRGMADELSESADDSESEQPRAQRPHAADRRPLRRGMAVRRLGGAGANARRVGLRRRKLRLGRRKNRNGWRDEIHDTHAPGCDGGSPVRGVAQLLSRQDLVCLFQHFFSNRGWTGEE